MKEIINRFISGSGNNKYLFRLLIAGAFSLSVWMGLSPPLYAQEAADSVTIRMICDPFPPGSITDLAAVKGDEVGKIKLNWTAPGDNGNTKQLVSDVYPYHYSFVYYIKLSESSPADFGGHATSWWELSVSTKEKWLSSAGLPGTTEEEAINDLKEGATYWAGIKARDKVGNWSPELKVVSALAAWDIWPPAAITDFTASRGSGEGEVDLAWTAPGDDGTTGTAAVYLVNYASFSIAGIEGNADDWWGRANDASLKSPLPSPLIAGSTQTVTITGLPEGTTFYFAIKTRDDDGNISLIDVKSAASNQEPVLPIPYTIKPAAVIDLRGAATANEGEVLLNWTAPGDGAGDKVSLYIIKYATYSIKDLSNNISRWWNKAASYANSIAPAVPGSGETLTVKNLTGQKTYYFSIKSKNRFNTLSDIDTKSVNLKQDAVIPKEHHVKPFIPAGVKIVSIDGNGNVVIGWNRVKINIDGTNYTKRGGYRVYRSNSLKSGWKAVYTITTDVQATYTWEDTSADANNTTRYYKIVTVDIYGNESEFSGTLEASSSPANVTLSSDMNAIIRIPESVNALLYSDSNGYGVDIVLKIEEEAANDDNTLKVYRFSAINSENGDTIGDAVFGSAQAEIRIYYETADGTITGAPRQISSDEAEGQLSLYWFNGIEWIKLGGTVDTAENYVSVNTRSLGAYALRISYRGDTFEVIAIQPDKIFTPKSEYTNFIEFKYDNPKSAQVRGEIYDLRGAFVADMISGNTQGSGGESGSLLWDGSDTGGSCVTGGVYIYQIEVTGTEEKVINGTVVVAR
ncbi:MAG: hypothetical protein ABIH89_03145 [Elusimicrobiota bacterium]